MNIPILLYHSVSDHSSERFRPWTIHPDLFAEHMQYLFESGYKPITVSDLANAIHAHGNGLPKKPVVITFDDGFADFMTEASPVLKQYGFPCTLYITTKYINQTSAWLASEGEENRPMLSWDEIRELDSSDIECGAHGHSHRQLDIAPYAEACEEILESKAILERMLDSPITSFSFPHGYHTKRLLKFLKLSEYSSGCTVCHSMASDRSDPYALPRIIIHADVSIKQLGLYLSGHHLRNDSESRILKVGAWRACRWVMDRIKPAISSSPTMLNSTGE
jgi:peptidoglycan/xylan/chitin deacetylase (PgdA/CDA1 family)